jgi:very-short-patch-repair endonuclease
MGYRIDFFLPKYELAIEYDESHHAKPLQAKRDKERQKLIASKFGVKFIRVRQGKELQGINRILRFILSRPSKSSFKIT